MVRSASPSRLEEINEERGRYAQLPDLDAALLPLGAVKLLLYALFVSVTTIEVVHTLVLKRWATSPEFAADHSRWWTEVGLSPADYALVAVLMMALLAFAELIAIIVAGYHKGRLLYRLLPLVSAFAGPGAAVEEALTAVAGFFARLAGLEAPPPPLEAAEDEILDAVSEGEREGVIEDHQREMIESIIEFRDVEVTEVMTPRTELTMIDAEMTLRQGLPVAVSSGHSRLPVLAENADNVIGVLYAKDILQFVTPDGLDAKVRSIMRAPYFVPETKMVRELLQEFRTTTVHMAIVLDEYGGTAGIVTIEDIIEEIVGEIEDEYDEHEPPDVRKIGPRRAVVEGDAPVDEVNEALAVEISEDEEYETIAGYVLFKIGRIPAAGETFEFEGLRLGILEADERRIKRLSVQVLDADAPGRAGTGK
jgi:CBS domain containing-hemolysin-like protein